MANSRVLKTKGNLVTWGYKKGIHNGIDIVGTGSTLDYIVAHSDGTVVQARNNYATNDRSGGSYGNYVLIRHNNGMYTLYAHMRYNFVTVKAGQAIKKGQVIGYMGNTGYAFGAHLHFEVRDKNNNMIDPTKYINADLPASNNTNTNVKYQVGKIYKTQVILKVRCGAGTNYSQKTYSQLTKNAQANAYANGINKNCLEANTEVTCLEVKNIGDDVWIRIPSGWIASYYNKQWYVK